MKSFVCFFLLVSTIMNCTKDKHCLGCYQNQCISCEHAYLLNNNCVVPQTKINHCLEYEKEAKCKYCELGYMLAKDGSCAAISIEECAETNGNGVCTMCFDTILVDSGKCVTSNKCSTSDCEICSRDDATGLEVCALCSENYGLDYSKSEPCVELTNSQANC